MEVTGKSFFFSSLPPVFGTFSPPPPPPLPPTRVVRADVPGGAVLGSSDVALASGTSLRPPALVKRFRGRWFSLPPASIGDVPFGTGFPCSSSFFRTTGGEAGEASDDGVERLPATVHSGAGVASSGTTGPAVVVHDASAVAGGASPAVGDGGRGTVRDVMGGSSTSEEGRGGTRR